MYNDGSVYIDKPRVGYISNDMTAETIRVKWKWHLGDGGPMVHVSKRLLIEKSKTTCRNTEWRIRYPETAPVGARYELIVDEDPPLTAEQAEIVKQQKAEIFEVWRKEKIIQNRLLALWPHHKEDCIPEAIAIEYGDRWIRHRNTMYVKDCPFDIQMVVTTKYNKAKDSYEIEVVLKLVEGDNYIELTRMKLPIVDGKASLVPLLEYLGDNPLMGAGRALSKVGRAIKKAGEE